MNRRDVIKAGAATLMAAASTDTVAIPESPKVRISTLDYDVGYMDDAVLLGLKVYLDGVEHDCCIADENLGLVGITKFWYFDDNLTTHIRLGDSYVYHMQGRVKIEGLSDVRRMAHSEIVANRKAVCRYSDDALFHGTYNE